MLRAESLVAESDDMKVDNHNEGVALILALLFVVLLSAIVVSLSYEIQVEAAYIEANKSDFEAYVAAKSAVAFGMAALAEDIDIGELVDENENVNLNNQTEVQTVDDGCNSYTVDSPQDIWATKLQEQTINVGDAEAMCSIDDEYGKLNLNALVIRDESGTVTGKREVLVEAFRVLLEKRYAEGQPDQAILDWLDGDEGGVGDDSWETDYYSSLDVPFSCKNGRMDSIDELLLIPGITPEIYYGLVSEEDKTEPLCPSTTRSSDEDLEVPLPLSELFTVHGHPLGYININTIEMELLEAIIEAMDNVGSQGQASNIIEEVCDRRQQAESDSYHDDSNYNNDTNSNCFDEDSLNNLTRDDDPDRNGPKPPKRPAAIDPQDDEIDDDVLISDNEFNFIVHSDKFRIRGDAKVADTRVRIETYVLRLREETKNEVGALESFYTLDWRVIR